MGRRGNGGGYGGGQVVRYGGGGGGGSSGAVAKNGSYNYQRVFDTGTVQRGQHQHQTFRQGSDTVYQSVSTYESVNEARGTSKHGLSGHMTTYRAGGQGSVTKGVTMYEAVDRGANQVRRGTNTFETVNRGSCTVKQGVRTTETVNQDTGAVRVHTSSYERVKDGPNRYYSVTHHKGDGGQRALKGGNTFMLEY